MNNYRFGEFNVDQETWREEESATREEAIALLKRWGQPTVLANLRDLTTQRLEQQKHPQRDEIISVFNSIHEDLPRVLEWNGTEREKQWRNSVSRYAFAVLAAEMLGEQKDEALACDLLVGVARFLDPRLLASEVSEKGQVVKWSSLIQMSLDILIRENKQIREHIESIGDCRPLAMFNWQKQRIFIYPDSEVGVLSIALELIDRSAWLSWINSGPISTLADAFIYLNYAVREQHDILLKWIQEAPPLKMNVAGTWAPQAAISLVSFGIAELEYWMDYLRRREESYELLDSDKLSQIAMINEFIGAIKTRDDSACLLAIFSAYVCEMSRVVFRDEYISRDVQTVRRAIYFGLVRGLGESEVAYKILREHARLMGRERELYFWMASLDAFTRAGVESFDESVNHNEYWEWFRELSLREEFLFIAPYNKPSTTTVRLVGMCLSKLSDPIAEFDDVWITFSTQRVAEPEDQTKRSKWNVSFLFILTAFAASCDPGLAKEVRDSMWDKAMERALTGWLTSSENTAFECILYGVRSLQFRNEEGLLSRLKEIFAYFRGCPEEVAWLCNNLFKESADPSVVLECASAAELDLEAHLLAAQRYPQLEKVVGDVLDTLRGQHDR